MRADATRIHPAMSRFIPNHTPCGRTRREFLWQVGGGFAGLALADLIPAEHPQYEREAA